MKKRKIVRKSISRTMLIGLFIAINIMPLFGYIFMTVVGPQLYYKQVVDDIEQSILDCIYFYNLDLDEIAENPEMSILVVDGNEKTPFSIFSPGLSSEQMEVIDKYLFSQLRGDVEVYEVTLQADHLLDAIAMSKSAVIELTDMDGNVIYETPEWYAEALKNPGRKMEENNFKELFLPKNSIQDNRWISKTKVLNVDNEYNLTVKLNITEFMRSLEMITRMYYYIMLFGCVVAIVFSVIMTKILTKPLKELQALAKRMEDLDFSAQYSGDRGDEIGNLGRSLNHMMDRLGITINRLKGELDKEKRTDKLRKRFIAQVSHELKTPVAVVSNYVEALQDDVAETKEERELYLVTIEKECGKMVHIINDLLDISQLESGNFKVFKEEVDLQDILKDIGDKFGELISEDIIFDVDIFAEKMIVDADIMRIEQAVSNLLTNAVKHTSAGKKIKYSAKNENDMLHIKVYNEGKSISKDDLMHIWEPFTKGENEKGAGLGLSITKSIIELHDGEYYVRNTDGGVLFGIRLPLI